MQICPEAVMLKSGKVVAYGPSADVVKEYMGISYDDVGESKNDQYANFIGRAEDGDKSARLIKACLKNEKGEITSAFFFHQKNYIEVEFEVLNCEGGEYFVPNFHLYNAEGVLLGIFAPKNDLAGKYGAGKYTAICELPQHLLNEGVYRVLLALSSWQETVRIHFAIANALTFKVIDDLTDASFRNGYTSALPGLIRPAFNWSIQKS